MKFRVWDIKEKKYDSNIYIDQDGRLWHNYGDLQEWVLDYDNYIVEYSIGIEDREDKLIYEGDNLEIHQFLFDGDEYENTLKCSVKLEGLGVMAKNIICEEVSEYMGYNKKDQEDGKVEAYLNEFYGLHEESFTITGNIHDNNRSKNEV